MATEPEPVSAHMHSAGHREELLKSELCGCFFCLETYPPSAIEEWVDEVNGVGTTALCPRCGIDFMIGSASGIPITREFLQQMKSIWFW